MIRGGFLLRSASRGLATLFCIISVGLALTSCASRQIAATPYQGSNDPSFPAFTQIELSDSKAALYVYRSQTTVSDYASPTLYLNNEKLLSLEGERHIALILEPGEYVLETRRGENWDWIGGIPQSLPLLIESGRHYFVQVGIDQNGESYVLTVREPADGFKEIEHTLQITTGVFHVAPVTAKPGLHYPLSSSETRSTPTGEPIAIGVWPIRIAPSVATPFMRYRAGPGAEDRIRGAGIQALDGAKYGASLGKFWLSGGCGHSAEGCIVALGLALATSVTGATLGGIVGGISGSLAGDVELSSDLGKAVEESGIQKMLEEHVHSAVKDVPTYRVSRISYPENFTNSDVKAFYDSLTSNGTDSILELGLSRIAFVGTKNDGPHHLTLVVRMRTVSLKKSVVTATRRWEYESDEYSNSHTLKEWQSDNAYLLRQEVDRASLLLAEYVKREFLSCPPKCNQRF